MKRIQTLDILRGVAMLGLVFMHAFEKVGHNSVIAQIFTYPWYLFFPLGLLFYFASWRGFFLIISGAGNAYGFQKAVENGKSPHILLLRRLLWSTVLFFHGIFIQVFWNPYGGLYNVFQGVTGPGIWNLSFLQWSDAVETIAIGIFISSIIHYILILGKIRNKPWIPIIVFGVLTILIFTLTPYLTQTVLQKFGWTSIKQIQYQTVNNFADRLRWLSLALLIGEQQPLFPYLASSFLGSGIGIALTDRNITKKRAVMTGFVLGGFFIVFGVLLGGLLENFVVGISIIPNRWFLILGTGIQVWVLTVFLWIFDFSKKAKHLTNYTKTIRKAGILSLTIFTLQSFDFFPRWLLTKISADWGGGVDYITNSGWLEIGNAFLTAFAVLIFWIIFINHWGLVNFTLSFDWLFEIFRRGTSGEKINWKDPMRSREIIHNAEIVFDRKPT